MAELYVEAVIDRVASTCKTRGIGEGLFWDWLGNIKFKEDNGNLTPERAMFIKQNIDSLLNEYLGR